MEIQSKLDYVTRIDGLLVRRLMVENRVRPRNHQWWRAAG